MFHPQCERSRFWSYTERNHLEFHRWEL
jgi:hypothetical protein